MIDVLRTETLDTLLAQHAPVACGVSGGVDGAAAAFAINAYLDRIDHIGPRILIHSDLGRVEHRQSLPMCQLLADWLGQELVVVRRQKGDMMDRWLQRWNDNLARYVNLECVQLILPWSTPSMRFCTSELKVAVICRELVNRWPGQTILSASGIRRDESRKRAKAPILSLQSKLVSKPRIIANATIGYDWHPTLHLTRHDVLALHAEVGFPLHEHYTVWGAGRVSCAFCILANLHDLIASSKNPEHHDLYREMVELEIVSTFSFQGGRWLADVAPHLLDSTTCDRVTAAKEQARARAQAEARIPKHLHYDRQGWPKMMPSPGEARLLAEVRQEIGAILSLPVLYIDPSSILARYEELMHKKPHCDLDVVEHRQLELFGE